MSSVVRSLLQYLYYPDRRHLLHLPVLDQPSTAVPLPEPVRPCVRAKSPAADPAPPRPVRAPGGHVRRERRWKKRRFEIHDWNDSNPSYVSQLFLYLACCCDTLVLGLKLDAE